MKKTRTLAIGAFTAVAALSLAACSSSGSGGDDKTGGASDQKTIGTVDGSGKTLTVWAMSGDYTDETLKAINDKFKADTGADVKVETQQWADIGTKLTTALATTTPPDVIDIGNTQVSTYAATGGLADLSKYKDALQQGGTWLGSLVDPSTVDGKLYAVPSFAGNRAVIYNKKTWADAGVTEAPTTYADLKSDLDKIKAKNTASDFSAFYLPGQYWYAGLSWTFDTGSKIATQQDGKWAADFSDKGVKGLDEYKAFQNAYSSKASQTLNSGGENNPDQTQLFADGKTATIIGALWDPASIVKAAGKKLTLDDLGTFALPSPSGDGMAYNFGGGEVWGVAQKSQNQDLALAWLKVATSEDIQLKLAAQPWIPNTNELAAQAATNAAPINSGFFAGASKTFSTPNATKWATVEANKVMENLFSSVASGSKSSADAAKTADDAINSTLNG
ncbi:ABC transporter substrate-binding protein [Luteimicrobium album]|uniref:ABC transporter substrate-binding protein n=1 Tax=Luteimicrobium album TaxID=1054550 RepID=A0ABQ6I8W4_9MICO|nr:extracellular solute-binding protein [Luteimicrobium album]GMA26627.1 ABC transporter substrate-binding protein [Luteimicrobium album]